MNNFPCTYYVDCDGDGKKDLVATPNAFGSENVTSVWYYKNASATNTVNFQFVKKNFLQDEMIEVGQNSFPVIFDYNADGKKDLLIGTYGYYNTTNLKAQLALYENIGTLTQPKYSLITRDYAAVSTKSLNNVMPTIGDIDNDGDVDICVGTSSGQIHWLENTAGAGNICNFSLFHANSFSFTTVSSTAAPQLFDIDKDGKLDLMIGTKNGRISYYKNTGTASVPAYSLITSFFGGVDVKGDINLYGIDGYATPYFFNEGPNTKLLVGNISGTLAYYDVPAIISNTCNLITTTANNINEGGQSSPYFEDVNNDGKRDLFLGNGSGGLSFFSSINQYVGLNENHLKELFDQISLFPNPTNEYLNIRINELEFETGTLILYNMLGKEVEVLEINSNSQTFLLNSISEGIYFAKISLTHHSQTNSVTKKIIIN
jgi:hypothetical protein